MKFKFTVGADFYRAVNAFAAVTGHSAGFANRALTLQVSRGESWAWGVNGVCETFAEFIAQGAPDSPRSLTIDAVKLARVINLSKAESLLIEVDGRLVTVVFDDQRLTFESLPVETSNIGRPKKDSTSVLFDSPLETFHHGVKFLEPVLNPALPSQFLWFKAGKMFSSDGNKVRSYTFPPCKEMPFALSVPDTQKLLAYLDLYKTEEGVFAYVDIATRKFLFLTTTGADFRSYLKIPLTFETQRMANPISNVDRDSTLEASWTVDVDTLAKRLAIFSIVAEEDSIEVRAPAEKPLNTDHPSVLLSVRSTQSSTPSQGHLLVTNLQGIEKLKPFKIGLKVFDRFSRDVANGDGEFDCKVYLNETGHCLVFAGKDNVRQALVLTTSVVSPKAVA